MYFERTVIWSWACLNFCWRGRERQLLCCCEFLLDRNDSSGTGVDVVMCCYEFLLTWSWEAAALLLWIFAGQKRIFGHQRRCGHERCYVFLVYENDMNQCSLFFTGNQSIVSHYKPIYFNIDADWYFTILYTPLMFHFRGRSIIIKNVFN